MLLATLSRPSMAVVSSSCRIDRVAAVSPSLILDVGDQPVIGFDHQLARGRRPLPRPPGSAAAWTGAASCGKGPRSEAGRGPSR